MARISLTASKQLLLALPVAERQGREDFFMAPGNARALELVSAPQGWPDPVLLLTGPAGVGKSHLAHIFAAEQGAMALAPRDLEGLSHLPAPVLVLDGADQGLTHAAEVGLFHLTNLVRAQGGRLLLTARRPPQFWGLVTPDLVSRLRLAPMAALAPPDADVLRAAMVKLIAERQLSLEPALLDVLANRLERSIPVMRAAIARLDQLSLEHQRPITRAMVYAVIGDGDGEGYTEPEPLPSDKDDDF
ncbi:MAG: hypothetical protein KGQ37_11150 [Hyphomicrobiales bacterium]|nr:hypothetical protein [Hyphomicrobiales bacterium]